MAPPDTEAQKQRDLLYSSVSRTGLGHESLSIFHRCARNLHKCSLPRLDCFTSQEVGKTCLRLSSPDRGKEICLFPEHDKRRLSSAFSVSRTGLEPARDNSHYPLKVARLPVPPPGHVSYTSAAIMHKSPAPCNVIRHSTAAGHRCTPAHRRAHRREKQRWSHRAVDTAL